MYCYIGYNIGIELSRDDVFDEALRPHRRCCLYKETNVSGGVLPVITSHQAGLSLVTSLSSGYCPRPIGQQASQL